jgi:hypothetical protein
MCIASSIVGAHGGESGYYRLGETPTHSSIATANNFAELNFEASGRIGKLLRECLNSLTLFGSIQPIALPTQSHIPRLRFRAEVLLPCLNWNVSNRVLRCDAVLLDWLLPKFPL